MYDLKLKNFIQMIKWKVPSFLITFIFLNKFYFLPLYCCIGKGYQSGKKWFAETFEKVHKLAPKSFFKRSSCADDSVSGAASATAGAACMKAGTSRAPVGSDDGKAVSNSLASPPPPPPPRAPRRPESPPPPPPRSPASASSSEAGSGSAASSSAFFLASAYASSFFSCPRSGDAAGFGAGFGAGAGAANAANPGTGVLMSTTFERVLIAFSRIGST